MKKLITTAMAVLLIGLVFAGTEQSSNKTAILIVPDQMISSMGDVATSIGPGPMTSPKNV